MAFRVRDILLVSSRYDSYVLLQDAFLGESLDLEYRQLNLSAAPQITQVESGAEALEALGGRSFDLVITMARLGEMAVREFARSAKERHPELPVVLLAYSPTEAARFKEVGRAGGVDQVFVWRGDVRIFLAIIKYVEDRRNAEPDAALAGVRAVLLIENSVRFYSSYLPLLYTEIVKQTASLMADGVNAMQRLRRMKARPKVLLAENYEEGWKLYERHREWVLGIITDARFPRGGQVDPEAGLDFARRVKAADPDMPVLVQSSAEELAERAQRLGASFVNKRSPRLLEELRGFMQRNLGFGDFVFLLPDGTEVGRAADLPSMIGALEEVPAESVSYHATRNHFSNWCRARTEFALAARLRPVRVTDFPSPDDLRRYLLSAFEEWRADARRGVVAEFARLDPAEPQFFARIGGGSMGGKGRGLAFVNALLPEVEAFGASAGMRVAVPSAAVIGTDVFDQFLEANELAAVALSDAPDAEIEAAFLRGRLPDAVMADLGDFVERVRVPVAVRSSSLLEDSHDQPFAGIYRTVMLANHEADAATRQEHLAAAVRRVYASTFFRNAKAYLQNTPHRMEEEKMAVVLQRLVGRAHGRHFYPDFSGVACSHNFYPVTETRAEDGAALVALGFGKTVMEGERAVRFSPARPRSLPQFSSPASVLENAQRQFWALDLERAAAGPLTDEEGALVRLDLDVAERDGTLGPFASVYSPDNDAVYDGLSRAGVRLCTFAPILKDETSPLPPLLRELLRVGSEAMRCPVEIEFAVDLRPLDNGATEFGFLQIRPMVVESIPTDLDGAVADRGPEAILCRSPHALGHGRIRDVRDVIYVKPASFDRARTAAVAGELEAVNASLERDGRGYLLIGPGRWGTADPWLGVPVEWHHISAVRAIVETDLGEVQVAPSEGTHFFQNLTSLGIGYFHVDRRQPDARLDYEWLDGMAALHEGAFLRHVRMAHPLEIWVDARTRRGAIVKGEPA